METIDYTPLNLYTNFQEAAERTPDVSMIFDQTLVAFPELGFKSTYSECHELVVTRAYQLASLGVTLGDKIMIYKSSAFDTYLMAVAASYLGAIPVMPSYHLPTSTLEVFVDRLEDPFILFDEVTSERVAGITNGTKSKQLAVADLLKQPATPVAQKKLDNDEISYMTHTSGTTGIPKLICHSAHSMGWRTKWQKTVFTKITEKKLVAFHISPVHSRFNIGISSLMAMGFPMMPIADPQGEHVVKLLLENPPIALETHPNNFVQWSFTAREHPEAFSGIRYYHSTFDAINNQTMEVFLQTSATKEAIFLQVYGQSECGPMILKAHTLESLKTSDARDMGVGLGDLTKARITDEEGNELPENTDGHIHLLSKGRALTYYKEDARFQENVYGVWWDSGDYGCIDENGHLHLKDRQVDLIDTINSTLAIEDYLLDSLEFLAEVVIVRDKDNSPQPIIALAPNQEMDWDRWWNQVHELPRLNTPIIRAYEDIPRTATMKVQRLQIEKEFKEANQ
ncbi:AMP-binding protein [Enterococcus pernyi]|uniref:Acetate--CoA ligase n=1 Tax=Enterococcus mundtii TaxID=53346 RepID=A0A1V2UKT2_ENTMU|nr:MULTISPECIES: acyl-CoA synthetase [Enterococcus]NMP58851.1 acyl-CoA synthetase [Enterococcus mundtii]ONN44062.1 acetate--CoA ligase [Enterococcus mundtii]